MKLKVKNKKLFIHLKRETVIKPIKIR